MPSWLRPSKQRSIKKLLFVTFIGCWCLLLLNAVWHSYGPVAFTPPSETRNALPPVHNKEASGGNSLKNSSIESSKGKGDDYKSLIDQRLQSYKRVCENKWTDTFVGGKMSLVFYDEKVSLGYCFVAKIGCTFWFRLLSFLTRAEQMKELKITNPLDIDRSKLHTGELGPKKWQYIQDFKRVVQPNTLKFLFTRNPYERLWSVYLDKYYLIDYWVTNPIADTQCGTNVTFQMFLEWAVKSTDHHLVPVNDACEPCAFKPDFIGKMETFAQDTKYLLQSTGYEYLVKDYNRSLYVDSEIKSLVVYNFKSMKYSIFASGTCLSFKEICQRMWYVFQLNGFIKDSIPFPEDRSDYSEGAAIEMFLDTVHRDPITKEMSRAQRREALVGAYSKINWKTIQDVQERYKLDFEMFDYSLDPPRNSL